MKTSLFLELILLFTFIFPSIGFTQSSTLSKAYYFSQQQGSTQKIASPVTIMNWGNAGLQSLESSALKYGTSQANAALAQGASMSAAQSALFLGINQVLAMSQPSSVPGQTLSQIYSDGLIEGGDVANGTSAFPSDVVDVSQPNLPSTAERTFIAQDILSQVGSTYGIVGSAPTYFSLTADQATQLTGVNTPAGLHIAITYAIQSGSSIVQSYYDTTAIVASALTGSFILTELSVTAGALATIPFDAFLEPMDLSGDAMDTSPGSVGEAIQIAEENATSVIEANVAAVAATPSAPVAFLENWEVASGFLSETAAEQTAEKLVPYTLSQFMGDALGALVGLSEIYEEVVEAPSDIEQVFEESMNLAVMMTNTYLGEQGGTPVDNLNGNFSEQYLQWSQLGGLCSLQVGCASSDAATKFYIAMNTIQTTPTLSEVSEVIDNPAYNPANPAAGMSPQLWVFKVPNPQGYAPCDAATIPGGCYGDSMGDSISQLPNGISVTTTISGVKTYWVPNLDMSVPYDFGDGNGEQNFPVYNITYVYPGSGLTYNGGGFSLPVGNFSNGTSNQWSIAYSLLSGCGSGGACTPSTTLQNLTNMTAGQLNADIQDTPVNSLLTSVDPETYEDAVGPLPPFSPSAPSQELGVSTSVNGWSGWNAPEAGTDLTQNASWGCNTTGFCQTSMGGNMQISPQSPPPTCFSEFSNDGCLADNGQGKVGQGIIGVGFYTDPFDAASALGGSSSGNPCFVAGTMVETPQGEKPIETVGVGDIVYSYDVNQNATVLGQVVQTFIHNNISIGTLVLSDGTQFVLTSYHPFYLPEEKVYRPAGELKVGDSLLSGLGSDAHEVQVKSVDFTDIGRTDNVYNFRVNGYQNYYVEKILVHNK